MRLKTFLILIIFLLALTFGVAADEETPIRGTVLSGVLSHTAPSQIVCASVTNGFVDETTACAVTGLFEVQDASGSSNGSHLNVLLQADFNSGPDSFSADNMTVGIWGAGNIVTIAGEALPPLVRAGFADSWTSIGLIGVSPTTCALGSCDGIYSIDMQYQLTFPLPLTPGQFNGVLVSQNLVGP